MWEVGGGPRIGERILAFLADVDGAQSLNMGHAHVLGDDMAV